MRNALLAVALAFVIAGWNPAKAQQGTFHGEIMDSQCASQGSHEPLQRQMGARNAKECSDACVAKMGGKYVLFDAGTTYNLDNQAKARQFSGQHVIVMGTYNKGAGTIHITQIQAQH